MCYKRSILSLKKYRKYGVSFIGLGPVLFMAKNMHLSSSFFRFRSQDLQYILGLV